MEIIYLILGLIIGFVISFLWLKGKMTQDVSKANEQLAALRSQLEAEQKSVENRLAIAKENATQQVDATKEAADRQLEEVKNSYTQRLEAERKHNEELRSELQKQAEAKNKLLQEEVRNMAAQMLSESREKMNTADKERLEALLTPLKDRLEAFNQTVTNNSKETAANKTEIKTTFEEAMKRLHAEQEMTIKAMREDQERTVKELREQTERIGNDAASLTKALKGDSKMQGDWGEMILEKTLEDCGLIKDLQFYCMTPYDANFKNVNVLFPKENVMDTLGEYLSKLGKKQLHTAETEKYAHVTFFFNGGREQPYEGEDRILVPSPKVATYDLQPEMSAFEVKDKLVGAINTQEYDFIVVNFANGDMVGHTGVYNAIAKAVWAVDQCVKEVVEAAKANDYETIIIADHGNADNAINEDGSPNTAHSLNPVPFIYVTNNNSATVKNGRLADVAPSILHIMGLEQPADMTGENLITD